MNWKFLILMCAVLSCSGCLDRPDVAASSEITGFEASQAVDGKPGTSWITKTGEMEYIIIEPKTRDSYNTLLINCKSNGGVVRQFTVRGSHDCENWKSLYQGGRSQVPSITEHRFNNIVKYRYYKIIMMQSSGKRFEIAEIELEKR